MRRGPLRGDRARPSARPYLDPFAGAPVRGEVAVSSRARTSTRRQGSPRAQEHPVRSGASRRLRAARTHEFAGSGASRSVEVMPRGRPRARNATRPGGRFEVLPRPRSSRGLRGIPSPQDRPVESGPHGPPTRRDAPEPAEEGAGRGRRGPRAAGSGPGRLADGAVGHARRGPGVRRDLHLHPAPALRAPPGRLERRPPLAPGVVAVGQGLAALPAPRPRTPTADARRDRHGPLALRRAARSDRRRHAALPSSPPVTASR
jgi:hypothetical protein